MFSFGSKYRNYLFDNNNLYSILTSFLVFFKKMCFFFNFFAEVNGTLSRYFEQDIKHHGRTVCHGASDGTFV